MPDSSALINQDAGSRSLDEPSLHDALQLILADESLAPARKSQWCCSLRRIPQFLSRDPRLVPARMGALKIALGTLHHANLGISNKCLQNHRSNLKAALNHARGLHGVAARNRPLSPAWAELMEKLQHKRLRCGLSRFTRFCSDKGISPESVSGETVEACVLHTIETSFTKRPNELRRQIPRSWNKARELIPDWPAITLSVPDFRRPVGKRLEDFQPGFAEDVERYLSWLGGEVILDKPERDFDCEQSTIGTRRREIVAAANAALESGIEATALQSLADLTAPDTVRRVLDVYLDRKNGQAVTFTIELAGKLAAISKSWCGRSGEELEKVQRYAERLARQRKSGLTDKNLAVIRQIKQPQVRRRLLDAPARMMARADREIDALHKAAVTAQIAVAIQILIVAPIRVGNLASLHLETNLMRPGGPEGPIHLVIPDYEVKNGVPLEFPLPLEVSRMIDRYITQFRHRLKGSNGPWLFPGEDGGHKAQRTLSEQITGRIWGEVGIEATPHQFRHIAAAIILEAQPGNYELVRRVLGHRRTQTSMNSYVGLESLDAARLFGELVLGREGAEE